MRHASAARDDVHTLLDLLRRINASNRTAGVLAEIVRCVHDDLGFGAVALACRAGDRLVTTNVLGPPGASEALLGRPLGDAFLEAERLAEPLGLLRWVPGDRVTDEIAAEGWSSPPLGRSVEFGEWDPRDLLFAPLVSATGELVGRLSVDLPPGGRFPDAALRRRLELFVVQAGLAISHAEQRAELAHRVLLAEAVRDIAAVTAQGPLPARLGGAAEVLARAFGARQSIVRSLPDADGPAVSAGFPRAPGTAEPDLVADLARRGLDEPPVELRCDGVVPGALGGFHPELLALLERHDSRHLVLMPFGADGQHLGHLVLARPGCDLLGPLERSTLADVARHLGNVVYSHRQIEHERRLAAELTELARYKAELVATISHELRTPLTSILGHAELLAEDDPSESVDLITERAHDLHVLVAGLLDDARRRSSTSDRVEVDLVPLCRAAVDRRRTSTERARLSVDLELPRTLVALADPREVDLLVERLLRDAVLRARPGDRVELRLVADGDDVELRLTEAGGGGVVRLPASGPPRSSS